MSVLIKGIDMPKEGGMTAIKIWPNGHVEVLIGFPMSNHPEVILEGARMNRKAVGIPTPHGRLIDADAEAKKWGLDKAVKYGNKDAEQQHFSYSTMMMYEIRDILDDAETVIESEE